MEGYSVTEAASVLGVPTERVWELLARGVLSGAPEGETGMRVYLQPRPAPAPPEARGPNGNGRRDEPELSPFRELLTEFRGLTERYGQALLALGEARGEVATLRSRVDLLEARMDLRLPASAPNPAASWASTPMPFPAERAVVPTVPAPHEPSTAEDHEAEDEEPRSRTRGPRRATESFAEALARAEDPSIPELPGAAETATAMATMRAETDAALPRDLPSADAVPVAEEWDMRVAAAPVDVQEAVLEDSDAPAPSAPDEAPEMVAQVPDAPVHVAPDEIAEGVAEESTDGQSDVGGREAVAQEAADVVADEVADFEVAKPSPETEEGAVGPREAEPVVEPQPVATEPLEWDSDRYTTAIEEPDWLAAEVIETRVEEPAPPSVALEPDTDLRADPVAEPAPAFEAAAEPELLDPVLPPAAETPVSEAPKAAPSAEEPGEETMLWYGRVAEDSGGASEMEVATAGTRSPVEQSDAAPPSFPGSSELDDALAALGLHAPGPDQPTAESAAADELSVEDSDADEWPPHSTLEDASRPFPASTASTSTSTSAGSASRAYRRLRRIFPG